MACPWLDEHNINEHDAFLFLHACIILAMAISICRLFAFVPPKDDSESRLSSSKSTPLETSPEKSSRASRGESARSARVSHISVILRVRHAHLSDSLSPRVFFLSFISFSHSVGRVVVDATFEYPPVQARTDDLSSVKPTPYRPFRWGDYQ